MDLLLKEYTSIDLLFKEYTCIDLLREEYTCPDSILNEECYCAAWINNMLIFTMLSKENLKHQRCFKGSIALTMYFIIH